MKKSKLDELLVTRGFMASVDDAKRFIMAGKVLVDDQVISKPGTLCESNSHIRIKDKSSPYVSRGGDKLASFLDTIDVNISNRCALDIGISTGGFTDVLLQREAKHVLGIDVGYGILDYKLRKDPRVSLLERTNAREVTQSEIDEVLEKVDLSSANIDLVVMDVSFISVFKIFPNLVQILNKSTDYVVLIKPQFEAQKDHVDFGGIVTNPDHLAETLMRVDASFKDQGFDIIQHAPAAITGTKGNQEFLYFIRQTTQP